jgi:hypothetical protein
MRTRAEVTYETESVPSRGNPQLHSNHFFDSPANQSLAGEPSRPAKANTWPKRRRFTPYLILAICIFFWLIAALNLCGQDRVILVEDRESANHPARFYRAMEK